MFRARSSHYTFEPVISDTLLQLLCTRSLGEVSRDVSLHPKTRREFSRVKGRLLFQHLLEKASQADLFRLHRQLERRFPARPVDLDTLFEAIREVTGEDPRPFIKEWHDGVEKLPEFVVRDARVETFVAGERRWQRARFKIHNRGVAGGTISVSLNAGASMGRITVNMNIQGESPEHFFIAPGAYKEVHASRQGQIFQLKVDFGLSMNVPPGASFSFNETGAASDDTSVAGERDIDPAAFPGSPPDGTIIVDDGDEGFRVVEPLPWLQRFLPREEGIASGYLPGFGQRSSSRWTTLLDEAAHGDAVKSARRRLAGTGKSRVEWTTTIDKEGVYDLHAFASHVVPFINGSVRQATYHYSISTPGEETLDVPLKLFEPAEHWVYLGRFRVKPGTCTVSLSDRVTAPEATRPEGMPEGMRYTPPTLHVYADAIRWTRVDTP
jgi:hypothetical protein